MYAADERPSWGVTVLVAVLILVALTAGVGFEQVGRMRDRERFPQIGRSVDIGGRTLNVYCSGTGAPAVVFESGAPRSGFSWVFIQRETARFTRTCWYDRAGFGWSELGPYPRTSAASARDLHALLGVAGIPPPYVLVAETLAALDARVYTGFYPEEVAGMVLVDAVHPDLFARMPQIRSKAAPIQKYVGYPQNVLSQIFNQIGVLRLVFGSRTAPGPPPPELTQEEWATIWRLTWQPTARTALMQELPSVDESLNEARAAGSLGNRPLIVIHAQNIMAPPKDRQVSEELQADLARLSIRGTEVSIPENSGYLHYQAPHAVIDAIRSVVSQLEPHN